jgi:hypothetical protein
MSEFQAALPSTRRRLPCKFVAKGNHNERERSGVKRRSVELWAVLELAARVLAIAADFHHMRLLGLFAVFAAILAALLGPAIAGGMRAFIFRIVCHKTSPLSD